MSAFRFVFCKSDYYVIEVEVEAADVEQAKKAACEKLLQTPDEDWSSDDYHIQLQEDYTQDGVEDMLDDVDTDDRFH